MKMVRQSPDQLVLLHRPRLLSVALGACVLMVLGILLWHITQGNWVKAGAAFALSLALLAPTLWFATERIDVCFDTETNRVSLKTRRFTGEQEETYKLSALKSAIVETYKGPAETAGSHRVALVIETAATDDQIPLTKGYAGGRNAAALANRINTWLETARNPSNT
ncbi:MAG: hypothetical protein AB8B47_05065 [Roseobacter sp.]